ncbi:uncharacterized protein LOC129914036 [Episyrphus balteatus]|uniref:uncharacterized protein LOC129914036 n=1 Tax=Episyrphus balteatus TaxID=286459 RepID=UPI0024851689|nr:uncharacterized protein LOC129914036 [Episyrphus balteatus]
MWRIIICAVLLLATSSSQQLIDVDKPTTIIAEKEKDPTPVATTILIQENSTPTPLPPNKPSTEAPAQLITEVTKPPVEVESPSSTLTVEPSEEENTIVDPKRRVITYDQRQEGQYNIRADLENFMIVFIPPSPVDGVNLLDLLSKSTKRTKSSHKKYHGDSAPGSKYRQSLKSGAGSHNFNFLARHHQQSQSQSSPHIIIEEHQPSARIAEYIEGRTPYRVDISSTHSDLDQLQQEHQQQFQPQQPHGPQVDVLPPPYPLNYHHLIKPFHLEAEPTVIQALPPQSALNNGGGKFMDSNGNFFRMARAIQGGLYGLLSLDSNRVQPRQRTIFDEQLLSTLDDGDDTDDDDELGESRTADLPLSNDRLEEAVHNYVYPPLNPLRFNPEILDLHSRSMHSSEYPKYPSQSDDDNDNDNNNNNNESAKTTEIELKLLGATKECGPDRKRDSYGICRFAEGY